MSGHWWSAVDWQKIVSVFSALLTPVIAIVAAYIAWQQYQMKRRETRLALYEKRMEIFNAAAKLIAIIIRDAKVEIPDVQQFGFETRNAEFLFGDEVKDYLDELHKKALKLYGMQKAAPPRQDFDKETELLVWFSEQLSAAKQTFSPYLDLRSH